MHEGIAKINLVSNEIACDTDPSVFEGKPQYFFNELSVLAVVEPEVEEPTDDYDVTLVKIRFVRDRATYKFEVLIASIFFEPHVYEAGSDVYAAILSKIESSCESIKVAEPCAEVKY